ncbi:MAG: UDP-N-acetylmuramoyl-tripeptide--D-alanyl-D-alanine ligase [Candidatus Azotimanducaceae bacterium]|jgi:UDP-N-acetylmuramoyl-tripeptide--D-alanyl-D-alanine ligase
MMALWTWAELSKLGNASQETGPDISGVSIDSRQTQDGDLFVALSGDPGPRFFSDANNTRDGHEFINTAVAAGANAVMLSRPTSDAAYAFIGVSDTLEGLWALGGLARQRCAGRIVAITGSAGKTTARSWLMQCLADQFDVHGSLGSLNNHWGVPLSLSRMPRESDIGIFEIGTNHSGEISPLSRLVQPHISILLNVLPAHIGNFESFDSLEQEKRSIADGLVDAGCLILPESLATGHEREFTFGIGDSADVCAQYEVSDAGWDIQANISGELINYRLTSGGEHRLQTSLAVLATAKQLGADLSRVALKMSFLESPEGRGDESVTNGVTVIDDSYNANPVSVQYALDALQIRPGRRFVLLGEIMELGDLSPHYHRELSTCFSGFDRVITVGAGFAATPGDEHYTSTGEINMSLLVEDFQPGDTILVKGSNKVFWVNGFVKALRHALAAKKKPS